MTAFDRGELDNLLADLESGIQGDAPSGVDPYVNGFFESGVQTKEPGKAQAPAAAEEAVLTDGRWNITVSNLTADDMETLTAFLDSEGFSYSSEQIGGAA